MRHSIIIAATAVACAIAASVAIGCDPAEKNVSPFDFSLVAEPVDQGEPVTVTIALTRAGDYSSFRFAGTVYELDAGYATVKCSNCSGELKGRIITNEPPDYAKPLKYCPFCGAKFE